MTKSKVNVLSLFDGMSCGQIALKNLGIEVGKYYASEIDKYAMQIAKKNFPDTVHVGDVTKLDATNLDIDLLIGGSPCQGFSFAGKQLKFDDPRSKLFFELKPIEINSSLLSAQSRKRLYWTNIPFDKDIEDKGILLRDILDEETDEAAVPINERNARHFRRTDQKGLCMTATMYKGAGNNGCTLVGMASDINGHDILKRIYSPDGKAPTLNSMGGGNREPKVDISTEHDITKDRWRKLTVTECERLQTVPVGYTEGVSNTQRYKMLGNGWTVDVISHIFKGMTI
jgi:site-specific DNA-cytosine methylase